jgi:hypothetical protein
MISVDIIPFSEGLSLGRSWPLVGFDPDSHIVLYLLVRAGRGHESRKKKKATEVRLSKQDRVCHLSGGKGGLGACAWRYADSDNKIPLAQPHDIAD